jgi:tyrosine-protein phosphatase YwqE
MLLRKWIANGILFHVGASSIQGETRKGNRKWALKLLRNGFVHFIEMGDLQSVSRQIEQQNLYTYLEQKLPFGMVDQLKRNATYLASGEEFHSETNYLQ